MVDLNTRYLNLNLRSPLVVSALPLSERIDHIKQMEDAGAGAVVLFSLFEEQLRTEKQLQEYYNCNPTATPADALVLFPPQPHFRFALDDYLDHIRQAKEAVDIPIIASLNCRSLGSWTAFARDIEAAGADALELNIYFIPTNMDTTSDQIEELYLRILRVVQDAIRIPVAVKFSPYLTNVANMARRLTRAGASGLVLFNRFYQPDLDPKTLKIKSEVLLGTSQDARLPLHWIAILYGYIKADLAATGGIYTAEDVVKMLMAGANVTMLASVLLKDGIDCLSTLDQDLRRWLDENDYASIASLQGIVSRFHSQDPSTFERGEYIRAITSGGPVPQAD